MSNIMAMQRLSDKPIVSKSSYDWESTAQVQTLSHGETSVPNINPPLNIAELSGPNDSAKHQIIVIGHKNPDADATCSAIGYSVLKNFKNKKEQNLSWLLPRVAGPCNRETKYILEKFGFNIPEIEKSLKGKEVILVDHNAPNESVEGIKLATILKIIDHHRLFIDLPKATKVKTKPVGATCSIIASKMLKRGIKDYSLAGLLLSAMISDTIGFTGPTTKPKDKLIAQQLAKENNINLDELIAEILKVKTDISGIAPMDLLKRDGKEIPVNGYKFYIGQVEISDYKQLEGMDNAFFEAMEQVKKDKKVNCVMLMQTNIVDHTTRLLVFPPYNDIVERAFGKPKDFEYGNNCILHLQNVVSRKEDIIPKLDKAYKALKEEKMLSAEQPPTSAQPATSSAV